MEDYEKINNLAAATRWTLLTRPWDWTQKTGMYQSKGILRDKGWGWWKFPSKAWSPTFRRNRVHVGSESRSLRCFWFNDLPCSSVALRSLYPWFMPDSAVFLDVHGSQQPHFLLAQSESWDFTMTSMKNTTPGREDTSPTHIIYH
jgi:hypothetical protein